MFSAETTGPIFTKILHDIVALAMLLKFAYTMRYPIPFPNGIVTNRLVRENADFSTLIGCHGNVPSEIKKAQCDEQALTPIYQS